ncbi:hypothetical protein QW71_30600 [Paenibacillus sp. IHB B 3415]|nr:hypothetical protein QW71_30600 [Paenibacillus sp. IHB B 3415]
MHRNSIQPFLVLEDACSIKHSGELPPSSDSQDKIKAPDHKGQGLKFLDVTRFLNVSGNVLQDRLLYFKPSKGCC